MEVFFHAHIRNEQEALDGASVRKVLGGVKTNTLAVNDSCNNELSDLPIERREMIERKAVLWEIGYLFASVYQMGCVHFRVMRDLG